MLKHFIWRLVSAVITVALLLLPVLYSLIQMGIFEKSPTMQIKAYNSHEDTLHVVGDSDFPPFSYLDSEGNYCGHDIEVINEVANRLGKNVSIRLMSWQQAVDEIKAGRADLILGKEIIPPAVNDPFVYTQPLASDQMLIWGRRGLSSTLELRGRHIGVLKGVTYAEHLRNTTGCVIVEDNNYEQLFLAYRKGEYNFLLCRESVGKYLAHKLNLDIQPLTYFHSGFVGIAGLRERSTLVQEVNQAIEDMIQSGTMETIRQRWFSPLERPQTILACLRRHWDMFVVFLTILAAWCGFLIHSHCRSCQLQQRKRTDQRNTLIESLKGCKALYIVHTSSDGLELISPAPNTTRQHTSYSDFIARFIDTQVHVSDRDQMRKLTSLSVILQKLTEKQNFTLTFRRLTDNVPYWYSLQILRLSSDEILLAFSDQDHEIISQSLHDQMDAQYFALSIADLDTGMIRSLKSSPWYSTGPDKQNTLLPYSQTIRNFSAKLDSEPRAFFEQLSNPDFVRHELATENRRSYTYFSPYIGKGAWVTLTSFVLSRHDDGSPATFSLGFALTDSTHAQAFETIQQNAKQKTQLEKSMEIVGGLASEYDTLYHLNLDTDQCTIYHCNDRTHHEAGNFGEKEQFKDIISNYYNLLVHPDDRAKMRSYTDYEFIRSLLRNNKVNRQFFRRDFDGIWRWVEQKIIKLDPVNEEPHELIFGFIHKDAEIRKDEEQQALLDGLSREYHTVWLADGKNHQLHLYRSTDTRTAKTILQDNAEATLYEQGINTYINVCVHEDDRERVRQAVTFDAISRETPDVGTYVVTYRYLHTDRRIDYHQMCFAKAQASDGTINFILAFRNADKVIRKELERNKQLEENMTIIGGLANEYLSLYYLNLNDQSCHIYSLDAERIPDTAALFQQKTEFFCALARWIETDAIFPDDRPVLRDVTPDFLREQLAHCKKITLRFRRKFHDTYLWEEMDAVKFEAINEPANAIALGFAERDQTIRAEQELQQKLKDALKHARVYQNAIVREACGYYEVNLTTDQVTSPLYEIKDGCVQDLTDLIATTTRASFTALAKFSCDFAVKSHLEEYRAFMSAKNLIDCYHQGRTVPEVTAWVLTPLGVTRCQRHIFYLSQDEDSGDIIGICVIYDVSEQARQLEQATLQEKTLSRCIGLLSEKNTVQALQDLLAIAGSYYQADRLLILEPSAIGEDTSATCEWLPPDAPVSDTPFTIPSLTVNDWLNTCCENGPCRLDAQNTALSPTATAWLQHFQADTLLAAPLGQEQETIGLITVINPRRAHQDLNILRTAAAIAYSQILQRKQSDEEHITLNKLSDGFLAVSYINLTADTVRTYSFKGGYKERFLQTHSYSETITNYIHDCVPAEEQERCLGQLLPAVLLEQFKKQNTIQVTLTDSFEDKPRFLSLDYLKANDEGTCAVICCRDITETLYQEREQQRQLTDTLAIAQAANQAKTVFLNNMSHDIRTPMNAIIGFTNLAASHLDNKTQVQEYLSKVSQSASHLLSLINDVLDMSRIESGKMNLTEHEENLSEILHGIRTIVQADIQAKQLDFHIDCLNIIHENIIVDKLRLNQILLNLLSNAIKYTPVGGRVSFHLCEKKSDSAGFATYEIIIQDNGAGMSEECLRTIFDPFSRLNANAISDFRGTGLSMSITKNIIDMMGGTIHVESQLNRGTEITVGLMFRLPNDATATPLKIEQLTGLRALVADDDLNACQSTTAMLRDVGMRPEWCTTGREAVIRVQEALHIGDLFRVCILDWLMPDMNGIETTRRIRSAVGQDIPIIVLTAYDWADIEPEARAAGVTVFLSKPVFPSDLHKALVNCCGTPAEKTDTPPEESCDFHGHKVLLVDDNPLNLEIATDILTEIGLSVETANDGTTALEKVIQAHPGDFDAILMDIQMPRMNGYEATRKIRELDSPMASLPIIAMTANAFLEDRKEAIEAGMNDHITKPIDVRILKESLARFIFPDRQHS